MPPVFLVIVQGRRGATTCSKLAGIEKSMADAQIRECGVLMYCFPEHIIREAMNLTQAKFTYVTPVAAGI
jgi:hypothetical protein